MEAEFLDTITTMEYHGTRLRLRGYFLPDICYTYFVSYYLVNRFLVRGRRQQFIFALITVTLLTYFVYLFLWVWDYSLMNTARDVWVWAIIWSTYFPYFGPPMICLMFLSFKFFKHYHRKIEESKMLISENIRSQLGQLKTQIHPHFLFNTLSNIHSFAINKPELARELVSKLADTMKYLIYECEATYVDLPNELKMIEDYVSLQRVRYSNALSISMNISGDCREKKIAPLFLVPLLENAFKHGTSQMLQDPWIILNININDSSLLMQLSNSKPFVPVATGFRSGIGLNNVRKRLELIYPANHRLDISSTHDSFCVEIEIPIHTTTEDTMLNPEATFAYTHSIL
ncbi:sensor histidine kinase [Flavitalea antarctica]